MLTQQEYAPFQTGLQMKGKKDGTQISMQAKIIPNWDKIVRKTNLDPIPSSYWSTLLQWVFKAKMFK